MPSVNMINISSVDSRNRHCFIDGMHLAGLRSISGDYQRIQRGMLRQTMLQGITQFDYPKNTQKTVWEFWAWNCHYPCSLEKDIISSKLKCFVMGSWRTPTCRVFAIVTDVLAMKSNKHISNVRRTVCYYISNLSPSHKVFPLV